MTEEKQRIAIAKACGWRYSPYAAPEMEEVAILSWIRPSGEDWQPECLPDYLNDLNAMHEAENTLDKSQLANYDHYLFGRPNYIRATARQRCEAFLKILNLWE